MSSTAAPPPTPAIPETQVAMEQFRRLLFLATRIRRRTFSVAIPLPIQLETEIEFRAMENFITSLNVSMQECLFIGTLPLRGQLGFGAFKPMWCNLQGLQLCHQASIQELQPTASADPNRCPVSLRIPTRIQGSYIKPSSGFTRVQDSYRFFTPSGFTHFKSLDSTSCRHVSKAAADL
ncbi:hypothetical protein C2S51_008150 [Perilla frutescens var. frutescens]|nr:hypothetical protein C2S51_008150 [Perilla frutescens var. frutescens]